MPPTITLRDVADTDLAIFFLQEQDAEAIHMAAFTAKDPADHAAFLTHWARIRADPTTINQTILVDGVVAGSVSSYQEEPGRPEVTYWLGREFWGQGVATHALTLFLERMTTRPVYARAARDNAGSLRVLAKCGFTITGESRGYANGRHAEIAEVALRRDA